MRGPLTIWEKGSFALGLVRMFWLVDCSDVLVPVGIKARAKTQPKTPDSNLNPNPDPKPQPKQKEGLRGLQYALPGILVIATNSCAAGCSRDDLAHAK